MELRIRHSTLQIAQIQPALSLLAAILALSLPSASAQTTATPPEASQPTPSTLTTSFTSLLASSLLSGSTAADATSTLTSSNSTTQLTPSRPPSIDNAPETFPNNADSNNDGTLDSADSGRSGLINYYFVFLALIIVLAFLGVYFLNRRRQARKAAWRTSGQNALQRDVDGWVSNARRWHRREESRRAEGLNEVGEAPPPYVAKSEDMGPDGGAGGSGGVQIPLSTLARDERERGIGKPPEYGEAMRADSTGGRLAAADGNSLGSLSGGSGGSTQNSTRPS